MDQQTSTQQPSGAKNFFLYFLNFALLYTVAINFGGLLFDFINKLLPVAADQSGAYFSNALLRFHLASLIIGTPAFLWLSRYNYRLALRDTTMARSAVRRWLTYITMIVAALIVIGDLIALVNSLLGGETTARFMLKSLVVLMIAGCIFYYYLTDVKSVHGSNQGTSKLPKLYFSATAIFVLAGIVSGFFFIDPPRVQKLRAEDSTRIMNLVEIESGISEYARVKGTVPASLSDIQIFSGSLYDPVTKEPYAYSPTGSTTYELCATFMTSSKTYRDEYYSGPQWLHDAGYTCFQRNLVNQIPEKMIPAPYPVN